MFQAVLFTVIAYLVACYGYGIYLLWKLYSGRRLHCDEMPAENPRTSADLGTPVVTTVPTRRAYDATAKAA